MPFELENPITGAILQVADFNFPSKYTWDEAKIVCQELGAGWRLPRKSINQDYLLELCEMEIIKEALFQNGLGNIPEGIYWSDMSYNSKSAWVFRIDNISNWEICNFNELHYVRAVKDI